jgi:conflict system STAND superfamily ATPase
MSEVPVALERKPSPYVGPRAIRAGEPFYGRELEGKALINKLLSGGITLLHAPSGAGKTSLIQASVVPWFAEQGFQVCAAFEPRFSALRVNLPPPEDLEIRNRYVFSLVNNLVGNLVDRHVAARMTFDEALALYARDSEPRQLVVIDQLEEALTLDPNDRQGQRELFRQLGLALRVSRRWALLAVREDYMGGLDRYRQFFANELRCTFRLDFLDEDSALRAVQLPATQRDVDFTDVAAHSLVADLRRVRAVAVVPPTRAVPEDVLALSGAPRASQAVEPASATATTSPVPVEDTEDTEDTVVYPYVEPVLLQVVCNNLWRILSKKRLADFTVIEESDLEEVRPYSRSLAKYYRAVVRKAAQDDPAVERGIRDWIERELLTVQSTRRPTRSTPDVENPDEVVKALSDRYLVRDDPRPGGVFWELSHDQLVQPIVEDNRLWRLSNLRTWQIQADEWYHLGRDSRLLLTGRDFRAARIEARNANLRPVERAFLEASRRLADEETKRASLEAEIVFFRYRVSYYRLALICSMTLNVCTAAAFVIRLLKR